MTTKTVERILKLLLNAELAEQNDLLINAKTLRIEAILELNAGCNANLSQSQEDLVRKLYFM